MNQNLKNLANNGIDAVGSAIINLLPADGFVKNALSVGLDKVTDLVFDPKVDKSVPLLDHSEIATLSDNLVPFIIGLVDKQILKVIDIPFVDGDNELMFEQGMLLQLEAIIRQSIADFLVKGVS